MAETIKFFNQSFLSFDQSLLSGGGISVTTSDGSNPGPLLTEGRSAWQALGLGAVEIDILLPRATVDNFILRNHNLSNYTVEFRLAGTVVSTISKEKSTDLLDRFFFPKIVVDEIKISITQVRNPTIDRAQIGQIIPTLLIASLVGYPEISDIIFSPNPQTIKAKGQGILVTKQVYILRSLSLKFKSYIHPQDIRVIENLYKNPNPFLIWPCGGDENQFRYLYEGIRLVDIYKVQTVGDLRKRTSTNYRGLIDAVAKFSEHI